MNVWGKVAGKRKQFLSLLCDGVPPYDACRQVWPHIKDVYGHVARIFSDAGFMETYARLTDYQSSREQLLVQCMKLVESPRVANDDKLAAIKAAAMLRGYIKTGTSLRGTKGKPVAIEDGRLLEKMAELANKAYKPDRKAN